MSSKCFAPLRKHQKQGFLCQQRFLVQKGGEKKEFLDIFYPFYLYFSLSTSQHLFSTPFQSTLACPLALLTPQQEGESQTRSPGVLDSATLAGAQHSTLAPPCTLPCRIDKSATQKAAPFKHNALELAVAGRHAHSCSMLELLSIIPVLFPTVEFGTSTMPSENFAL